MLSVLAALHDTLEKKGPLTNHNNERLILSPHGRMARIARENKGAPWSSTLQK